MRGRSEQRIVFAGTPEFAATILEGLLDSRFTVVCACSQPDRPAGRGRRLAPGPVKRLAQSRSIPVMQPASLVDRDSQRELATLCPDLVLVAAYGLLLPRAVLELPRLGCINVHASLLPRWRGAAPIQRAILAGDELTGVSIMQMVAALDAGPVLSQAGCPILPTDTGGSLHDKLARLGAELLVATLERLFAGTATATPQCEAQATYAPRLEKREAAIDWSLAAAELERQVRAFQPWPGSYTLHAGERLGVVKASLGPARPALDATRPGLVLRAHALGIEVATGAGTLLLERVRPAGGRTVSAQEFLNGHRLEAGCTLGDAEV